MHEQGDLKVYTLSTCVQTFLSLCQRLTLKPVLCSSTSKIYFFLVSFLFCCYWFLTAYCTLGYTHTQGFARLCGVAWEGETLRSRCLHLCNPCHHTYIWSNSILCIYAINAIILTFGLIQYCAFMQSMPSY